MKPYYADDFVPLYRGDCRAVLPTIGTQFDLILTDPPYGLGRRLDGGSWGSKSGGFAWDQESAELPSVLAHAQDAIVWGGNHFPLPPSRCWLVWYKPDAVRTMADVDLAWTNYDAPSRLLSYSISATNRERVAHPTQKPLALMEWCIRVAMGGPQLILDPFAGSGTTLRAAKNMNRRVVGIEQSEQYCEIAAERCRQHVLDLWRRRMITHSERPATDYQELLAQLREDLAVVKAREAALLATIAGVESVLAHPEPPDSRASLPKEVDWPDLEAAG